MSNSNLKAARLTASGQAVALPAHVAAYSIICGTTAGSVVFRDGGSGGAIICTLDTFAATAGNKSDMTNALPDMGMYFPTNVYLALTNVSAITIWYY